MSTEKICSRCGESKPYSEFHKCKSKKDGYNFHCKKCRSSSFQKMFAKDPEGFRESRREYKRNNRDKIKVWRKQWKENNREKYREQQRRQRKKVKVRIKDSLRNRLNSTIRLKRRTSLEYMGCDLSFLMGYLEVQFKEGMTWDNYGKWHIDHIKPCCLFDLEDEAEQLICFHYSNLQPLWAEENWKKGNKYDG